MFDFTDTEYKIIALVYGLAAMIMAALIANIRILLPVSFVLLLCAYQLVRAFIELCRGGENEKYK